MDTLVEGTARRLSPLIQRRVIALGDENHPARFKQGKVMFFIGGGNGSGKTVVTNFILDAMEKEGYDRNYIAKFGSQIFEDVFSKHKRLQWVRGKVEPYLHRAAGSVNEKQQGTGFLKRVIFRVFSIARDHALEAGAPIIIDYHMHDRGFVESCVTAARRHGYETILITPHIDGEKIIQRLENRKIATSKPFDLQRVLERHQGFACNFDQYCQLFDLSVVLDNNRDGAPPSVVSIAHKGGTQTIYDEDAYDRVKRKEFINTAARGVEELWQPVVGRGDEPLAKSDAGAVGQSPARNHAARESAKGERHFIGMIERAVEPLMDHKNR